MSEREPPKLPELPESGYDVWDDYYEGWTIDPKGPHERYEGMKLWNEQQMRSYGTACFEAGVRQERERQALECERFASIVSGPNESDGDYQAWMDRAAAIRIAP
jgi:hypothetical protein